MGREAVTTVTWKGETAVAKALLESVEVILRGDVRARIPRRDITQITVVGDELRLLVLGEPLTIALGKTEAERWATALRKPPPSLASKLGISADKPAYVVGEVVDDALAGALAGAQSSDLAEAMIIVGVLAGEDDLDAVVELAHRAPDLAIWCVYPKGSATPVGDAVVRERLRNSGYMDTKTSAVSDRLTATRYSLRRAPS